MSRSRKHTPCIHYAKRVHGMKRVFNKRIRRMGLDDVPSNAAYRRLNETALDDDWRHVGETYAQHRRWHETYRPEDDETQMRYTYYRWHLGK